MSQIQIPTYNMTAEEQVQYDSILKELNVAGLKKAVIDGLNATDNLDELAHLCMNAAITFNNKSKL